MSQQAGLPGLRARDSWTIISMFWTWNQDDKALLSSSKHFKRGTCKISSPAIVTQRYKPWVKTKTPYQPLLGSSVQFSRSVVSDSLRPHEPQHARPPCPSPTPGVYPNTCPSSWWCHPTISSSVVLFSSCPQSLPTSESFPMSQLRMTWPKYWSFSFSIISYKEHPGLISFRMDWLDLLAVQGTLKNLLQHHSSKASILWRSAFFILQLSDPYMILEKT